MLWSVVGYLRLKFSGDNIYEFFRLCKKNNIELKNINKLSDDYYADILSSCLKKVVRICDECKITISVEGRFGLAMKIFLYRNRIAFFLAAAVFVLFFVLDSMFIKNIKITGNQSLTDSQIMSVLESCDVYEGRFIGNMSVDIIKEEILKKCSSLSWVWIDVKGNTAYVDVREKIYKPHFFDRNFACNIVAERDGVVTQAVSKMGTLYAKEGTYVKKGELLIGGVYDSNEYAPVRFVHASGTVYARTSYTAEDVFSHQYTSYRLSDNTKNSYGVNLFGAYFEYDCNLPPNYALIQTYEKKIPIFGKIYLPLGFTNKKYCEIIKTECVTDRDETKNRAINELTARLNSIIPEDASVVNTVCDVVDNDDGTLNVSLTFECIEDIACELPIEMS